MEVVLQPKAQPGDAMDEIKNNEESHRMRDLEQKVRLGVGSAAAASAIFAPLGYKGKGILTAIAAGAILTGIFRKAPFKRLIGALSQ